MDGKHQFPTQEGSNQNSTFLNDKRQYSPWSQGESQAPPQTKAIKSDAKLNKSRRLHMK
jgi:hypothetical protein